MGRCKSTRGKTRAEAINILLTPAAPKTPPAPKLTPYANVQRMSMQNGVGKKRARKMIMLEGSRLKRW